MAERWVGVNKIRGFLTELWETLEINKVDNKQQKGGNPSRYDVLPSHYGVAYVEDSS